MAASGSERVSKDSNALRTRFSQAMSNMYRDEVPLYGDLLEIVRKVDDEVSTHSLPTRHRLERHGAIRLGTAKELHNIKRLFAIFGMHAVGYYDLSNVGLPVHATAFRPLTSDALAINPFRVFTSLLRRDLLDADVKEIADKALGMRCLFTDRLIELIEKTEIGLALSLDEEEALLTETLKIFRWHSTATVQYDEFQKLSSTNPILADIASFPSAHINHLTPRTLDIDLVQQTMLAQGIPAKDRIEGPPRRQCPILLRQTSFRALQEEVYFDDKYHGRIRGCHTARFGEVEQRGAALTPKGRVLYDALLAAASSTATRSVPGRSEYDSALQQAFLRFSDNWSELHAQRLVYFRYSPRKTRYETIRPSDCESKSVQPLSQLLKRGLVEYEPIIYEDFLPISAAGIFASNLKMQSSTKQFEAKSDRDLFEMCLGARVLDPTDLYEKMQSESLKHCARVLGLKELILD